MPIPRHRSRSALVVLAAAGVLALASAPAAGAEPPFRVQFRARIDVQGGGALDLRGIFREDGARVAVEASDLPPPASGAYDVVLSAGELNLLDVVLAEEPEGDFTVLDDAPGDLRLEALALDGVTLYDGDEIVPTLAEIEVSGHVRFRADLRFESGGRPRQVTVGGLAGRRFDGSGRTILKVVTGVLEPGEYRVRLLGDGVEEIEVPFTIDGPRLRRHITIKEWEDRLGEMARYHTAALEMNGETVATAPLGPAR
jgi:hypothetical protein